MRAIWYTRTGPAHDVLEFGDFVTPEAGPGEVLVRIHASSINPSDTKRRAGWRAEGMDFERVIPHSDGAGTIEAVGEGVEPQRVGRRVWVYNAQRGRAMGTCADYCVVSNENAPDLPDAASFAEGACLGVPAQTAHFAVTCDGRLDGQTVLVQGGAGAVGHFAVQWAKQSGATVIATVSSSEKAAYARAAGADIMIDYRTQDVVEEVRKIAPDGVERIIEVDFGANLEIDANLIRENGTIASYSSTRVPEPVLPYYPLAYKGVTIRLVQAYILPTAARERAISDINAAMADGALTCSVGSRFPLDQTADAHVEAEAGLSLGNVLVTID